MCFKFLLRRKSYPILEEELIPDNLFDTIDLSNTYVFENSKDNQQIDYIQIKNIIQIAMIGKGSDGEVILIEFNQSNFQQKRIICNEIFDKKSNKKEITQIKDINRKENFREKQSSFYNRFKILFLNQRISFYGYGIYVLIQKRQGGDMFLHLRKFFKFNEQKTKFYICEIILAIEYLHTNKIIYRNLRPEKILIGIDGHIKISDFNLSKEGINFNDLTDTICGKPEYRAPEIILNKKYDKSVDWWSLGVIMYEMLQGTTPFVSINKKEIFQKIINFQIQNNSQFSDICFDLLTKLLQKNPSQRLGFGLKDAQEIKEHPFFSDVDWIKAYYKKTKPPFIPQVDNSRDLKYFDHYMASDNFSAFNIQDNISNYNESYKDFNMKPQ